MRRILLLTTRLSVLTSVTAAGAVILLGHSVHRILDWPEDYRDAYLPLAILTTSFAIWVIQWPSISVLYATAKHQFYAYLSLGEAAANVALSAVLVQSAGLIGVSLGTALPLLFSMLLLQPLYVCRIMQLERGTYYREIGRTAFLAILYQAPLFVGVYGFRLSSFFSCSRSQSSYYPSCLLVLLCHTLLAPNVASSVARCQPCAGLLPGRDLHYREYGIHAVLFQVKLPTQPLLH